MNLTTAVPNPTTNISLQPADKVLTIGSCFAEVTGSRLQEGGFQVLSNPYGALYNPASVFNALSWAMDEHPIQVHDLVEVQSVWRHFHFHSDCAELSKEALIDKLTKIQRQVKKQILESKLLIITLGTAFVYYRKSDQQLVGNCHKIPAKAFDRKMLTIAQITSEFGKLLPKIKNLQPDIQILFSVSPVRHLKDGAVQNSNSKAILKLAVDEIVSQHSCCEYFPAFEIMMDELRDYRYYADDLTHPSHLAEEIIYDRFKATYLSASAQAQVKLVGNLKKAARHRPFFPQTPEHQKFIRTTLSKMAALPDHIDLAAEIQSLKAQQENA